MIGRRSPSDWSASTRAPFGQAGALNAMDDGVGRQLLGVPSYLELWYDCARCQRVASITEMIVHHGSASDEALIHDPERGLRFNGEHPATTRPREPGVPGLVARATGALRPAAW